LGSACRLDYPIYLCRTQPVCAIPPGLDSNGSKYFRFRNGKAHVVSDAKQYRSRFAPFFYYEGSTFIFYLAKKPAEICTHVQRADDDA
jgi:hypothetical protein